MNIVIEPPDDIDPTVLESMRVQEGIRAAELASTGTLVRVWRDPDRWANWGLWDATDKGELVAALDSLPLRPFMQVEIHPLTDHPNDPARHSAEPQPRDNLLET